jgi:hypothetical protein
MESQYDNETWERIAKFGDAKRHGINRSVALKAASDLIAGLFQGAGRILNIKELEKETIDLAKAFESYLDGKQSA